MPSASGIVVPLVTPLTPAGELDRRGLCQLVNHVIEGGVDGVFVAGTTGEFTRLPDRVRHELFALAAEYCASRVPLYAGISDTDVVTLGEHAEAAKEAGADFVVASLPYYFSVNQSAEAKQWFEAVLKRVSLPLLIYEIPGRVGASIPAEVVGDVASHLVGIKDSSGSPERMGQYLSALGNELRKQAYLCGSEDLLAQGLATGVDGFVPSMANVFPKLWATLWQNRKQPELVGNLLELVREINTITSHYTTSLGDLAWKKQALALLGVCSATATVPSSSLDHLTPLLREYMRKVDAALDSGALPQAQVQ